MAELKERTEKEKQLEALLLVMFTGLSADMLDLDFISPNFFVDKMKSKKMKEFVRGITDQSSGGMLAEIGMPGPRPALGARLDYLSDSVILGIAESLTNQHKNWVVKRRDAEGENEPNPKPDEILKGWEAKRTSITSITEIVSRAELQTREYLKMHEGIDIRTDWITERDGMVCPVCSPLHLRPESIWGKQFPLGPAAHPSCRCWLRHYVVLV